MKKLFYYIFVINLMGILVFPSFVSAIDFVPPVFKNKSYKGSFAGQSVDDPITLKVGESKEVTVKIKNVGTATWSNSGDNYVSVYTVNPNYRNSSFASSNWLAKNQPTKIINTTKPGEIAEVKIKLTAPNKIGEYREDFYLAAENLTWIESSYFYLKIKVIASDNNSANNSTANQAANFNFQRDLNLNMSGEDVRELQKFLNKNGFLVSTSGAGSLGNETLLFGSKTRTALIKFQIANKISPAVGYFGEITRSFINKNSSNNNLEESSSNTNSTQGINDQAEKVNNEYRANLVALSKRAIQAQGGEEINFKVRYANIGSVTWDKISWQEAGSIRQGTNLDNTKFSIVNDDWITSRKIYEEVEKINPNQAFSINFSFRAPAKKGEYIARFQLTADGHTLDGGTLELPITVTKDAPVNYKEPVIKEEKAKESLISEPIIRVGLYKIDTVVKVKSPFVYDVYSEGKLKGELASNTIAELKYNNGVYSFTNTYLNFTSKDFIRLVPKQNNGYFTLTNYERFVSWKGAENFNSYRGILEYKFSPKSNMPWVVNELPLDDYVAGIAETSNGAAMEYIKAILTAARSYAYFQINNGVPTDQRTYDVVATTADQLYLGYTSEVLMPRVVQAARATYGEMVTYQGTPVITPYFANTDGKTKTWSQVWGGQDKPWLIPVVCKYDVGKTLYGHGVGMSAADAAQRADKDDWTYDQLLKYYYTGVLVEKIY